MTWSGTQPRSDADLGPIPDEGRLTRLGRADERAERSRRVIDAERRIAFVARFLDGAVTVPGTGVRIGADAVIGLIPVVGDLTSAVVGGWIIAEARRARLPGPVIGRMVVNLVLDLVVGAIPVLGDIVDVAFRSNARNLALFRRHAAEPTTDASGHKAFLVGLLLVIGGIVWLLASAVGALLSTQIG